jgi:hypothetical protein
MITSQDRLQPIDELGDYPIKVLDIAPLIMVSLPTVSSFFSTCGCFFRGGRSPSGDLPPISLACGWPPGANGSPLSNGGASRVLGLKILLLQGKGGRTDPRSGLGRPAPGPTAPVPSWPGSVAPWWGHLNKLCTITSKPRTWHKRCHSRTSTIEHWTNYT